MLSFNKSFVTLVSLVILNCLGSGLIMLPPQLSQLGLNVFISWILTGIGAFSIGMIFVRLGEENQGQDYYLQNLVSEQLTGFWKRFARYTIFWQYWLFVILGNGFLSCTFLATVRQIFPEFATKYPLIVHFSGFFTFYLINRFGIQLSRRVTNLLSVIKILILIIFPLISVFVLGNSIPILPTSNPVGDVVRGMFVTLWPFVGIESIAMEGEINLKMIRPAMMTGVLLCLGTFILNTYVMMRNIPGLSDSTSAYSDLFGLVFGKNLQWIAVFAILAVVLGSFHGWTNTALSTASSGEDMLPDFLKGKNKYGVNEKALIFASVLPVLFVLFTQYVLRSEKIFDMILNIVTSMCLFIYLSAALAFLIRFLKTQYRSKRKRVTDALYIVFSTLYCCIAFSGSPLTANLIMLLIFILSGATFYINETLRSKSSRPL